MYHDVKAHLQDMLDIGAIRKLHSPWASKVILIQKKGGSLRSCIDLRKLNNQTHDDDIDAIIIYASRSLTKAESHYPVHKLEFLTLKWAVVEKFHEHYDGLNFDVNMDNIPLTYALTMAKLDAASHHWVASLANYNFQLYYRAGKTNINVDALAGVHT